ncbi:unnamed protein product [Anisakis simplex]|uniref:Uncharacterized protein n=1 Tax=Anisakis simplex TaxID=6269 RepID=A0A0M3K5G1_ANISI|nr:unnamed protein product [Anisakis simplex]
MADKVGFYADYSFATTAVHPYATPPPTAHPPPMKRTFDNVLTKAPSSSGTSQLGPKMDEPPRKSYRAPSPVKDYRNPSTLAFRDFSQT